MAFQLHMANPDPLHAPGTTERVTKLGIDPEYVISRDKKGNVLSMFKHNIWDCRIYGAPSTFNFNKWWNTKERGPEDALALRLTEEIKTICWLCMFEPTVNAGRSRGSSYLHQLMSILRAIARMAHVLGTTLSEAHSNTQFQVALRSSIANAARGFPYSLISLLKDVAYWQGIKSIECKVPCLVPETDLSDVLALLLKKDRDSKEDREYFPLIPTRLFGKLISGSQEILIAVQPYLESLEAYIKALTVDPKLRVNSAVDYFANLQRIRKAHPNLTSIDWLEAKGQCLTTAETIEFFGLSSYPEKAALETLRSFDSHLTQLQIFCALLIHAYSGMRTSEVQVMPFEPVVHSAAKGYGDLPVLVSHLKKFAQSGNFSRPLVWATSKEGLYAVGIAQKLARLRWFRRRTPLDDIPSNIPLFVGLCSNATHAHIHYQLPIAVTTFNSSSWELACQTLGLIIEEEDLEELRVFDAFRTWDENPDFAPGKVWPLSSHQIRRSVAVYASRSGMVSLPTLKTQFKHLSEVMTALYSENSSYAQNFLIDENGKPIENGSILRSFRDAAAFNMSVRFHEQVIESERRLSGAVGTEIQRAKDKGTLPKILQNPEETTKAVKQGRFSYRETSVGGCVLKTSCPHFGIDLVVPCTSGCKEAILDREKMEKYVESLRFDMECLSPNSRPYRSIVEEIEFVTTTYLQPPDTRL
ncbi:MAG: hypothetical protein B0W54_12685 [Cellvibrio sp. 79]|nr:MAG: hypothetical protein B0W54_12685 [Cellvibrio sp. 79]